MASCINSHCADGFVSNYSHDMKVLGEKHSNNE